MPEIDHTYHNAASLRTALLGKEVLRFEAPRFYGAKPSAGGVIEEVRSHKKSIEIIWDDGTVLETQMRMRGSWDLYRDGERWRKPKHRADVVIVVADRIAVCFNAADVDVHRDFDIRRHPNLGSLGPNLRYVNADHEECVDRIMNYQERDETIAGVLLDQRVMVGLGNVYRCELLWACEIHPWAQVGSLKRGECREIVRLAAEYLQSNPHNTPGSAGVLAHGGLAAYGRQGKPCPRCGDLIKVSHHGEAHRVLYWCPGCQVMHQPLMRPNFTPRSEVSFIERDISRGIIHPIEERFYAS